MNIENHLQQNRQVDDPNHKQPPPVAQSEQVNRVTAYIDTLRNSGAPHQQELAEDLASIIGYYKPGVAQVAAPADDRDEQIKDLEAQIKNLKDNVGTLIDERDAARKEWDKSRQEHDDTKQILENAQRNFEVRERDLKAELEKKNHGVAKDVPEEEHANLKTQSSSSNKPKHR